MKCASISSMYQWNVFGMMNRIHYCRLIKCIYIHSYITYEHWIKFILSYSVCACAVAISLVGWKLEEIKFHWNAGILLLGDALRMIKLIFVLAVKGFCISYARCVCIMHRVRAHCHSSDSVWRTDNIFHLFCRGHGGPVAFSWVIDRPEAENLFGRCAHTHTHF